jgi:antirestriction protein ArdC
MSTNENTARDQRDVYSRVTSQIVNSIESGVSNWKMPWHTSGKFAFSPINVTSKKPYRGINTVCLWAAAQSKQYERGECGAQVRRGEKATLVVFWKFANSPGDSQDEEHASASSSRLLFTRGYSVFNAAQVDGYTAKADADKPIEQRIASAEQFFSGINARVMHLAIGHSIPLPMTPSHCRRLQRFSRRWIITRRGHTRQAIGLRHASRCNRELGKRFGDNAYSVEELVAELTAAFTLAHLGLSSEPRADHAQYIASWLRVLKADKRAIFTAASKAQQAADFMIQQSGHKAEVAA